MSAWVSTWAISSVSIDGRVFIGEKNILTEDQLKTLKLGDVLDAGAQNSLIFHKTKSRAATWSKGSANLPNRGNFNWDVEGKRIHTDCKARAKPRLAKNLRKEIRGAIGYAGLFVKAVIACDEDAKMHALNDAVKRASASESEKREHVQSGGARRNVALIHCQLSAHPSHERLTGRRGRTQASQMNQATHTPERDIACHWPRRLWQPQVEIEKALIWPLARRPLACGLSRD